MSTVDPIRTQTLTYFLRPGDPAPSRPAALSLALFTADPGSSGAATNELAGSGYARQPIAFDAPTDGETQDTGAATFGPAGSGGWSQVTHVAVCASGTAGASDLLHVGALQTPVMLAAGQSLRIDAGQLTVAGGSATVDANTVVLAASGTRLFSYEVGDSLAGAIVSRASVATYRDANGVLQTATASTARDTHYVNGARTLLLEHAAANLLPYSEQLDNAVHGTFGGTFVPDTVAAPDGQQTADKFLESTTTGWHGVNEANLVTSFPDNAEGVLSCFAAPAGRSWMHNNISDKAGTHHEVWFDISTGTIGQVQPGVVAPQIVDYANGMWRVSFAADSGIGSSASFGDLVLGATTGDGIGNYTGSASDGIALWGVQFESGRYATSYIPNNGSGPASREADLVSWAYSFTPQESSGLIRFIELGGASNAGSGVLYLGNDQSTGPRLWIDSTGAGYRLVHDNGTAQVISTSAAAPAVGDAVALRWVLYDDGSVELFQSVNGGAEASGGRSAANVLAAAWGGQTLRLNSVGTGNVGLAGYTKCVVDTGVQSLETLDSPALPAAPSALSATANATTVTLTWTDNATNETGFYVYRKYTSPDGSYTDPDWVLINSGEPVPADTTDFDDPGLQVGATYQYQVTAFNSVGESAPSNSVSTTISAVPAAPADLAATVSGTTVTLAWTDNSNNEDGFHVYRKYTSPDGTYTDPNWVLVTPSGLAVNATSYVDTGLTAGATYHYYVAAFNSAGESAPSDTVDIPIPAGGGSVPAAPTGLTATAVSASRIDLTWTDNATDESGYEVHRSTVSGFTPSSSTLVQTLAAGAQSWSDQTVAASTTYYYRVLAVNDFGASSPSNEANATTPSEAFTNQPSGMTTISDEPWNSLPTKSDGTVARDETAANPSGWMLWDPNTHISLVADATSPGTGDSVLQLNYPMHFSAGSGPGQVIRQFSATEVFLACYWKTSSNVEETAAGLFKIFYVFQTQGSDRRAIWFAPYKTSSDNLSGNPWYMRMANEPDSDSWTDFNGSTGQNILNPGTWYKLELYLKASSADGAPDGVIKLWIDGNLYMNYADRRFRGGPWTEWHVDPVWGGVTDVAIDTISTANPAVITDASNNMLYAYKTGMSVKVFNNSNGAFNGTWDNIMSIDFNHISIPTSSGTQGTGGTVQQVTRASQNMYFDDMHIATK